jgi:hypothetical protein
MLYNITYLSPEQTARCLTTMREDRCEIQKKPDINEGKTHIEVAVFNVLVGCKTYLDKDRNANLRNREKV